MTARTVTFRSPVHTNTPPVANHNTPKKTKTRPTLLRRKAAPMTIPASRMKQIEPLDLACHEDMPDLRAISHEDRPDLRAISHEDMPDLRAISLRDKKA